MFQKLSFFYLKYNTPVLNIPQQYECIKPEDEKRELKVRNICIYSNLGEKQLRVKRKQKITQKKVGQVRIKCKE